MAFKRFSDGDVFDLYKTAYRIKINWEEILEPKVYNFLDVYEKSTNCSKGLVIPSLMALTSSLCGPRTKVKSSSLFASTLNSYIFSVCDPGGGKSLTFDKVVEPVLEAYFMKTGKRLNLENYTTAGIQKHQIDNKGIGLVTSDEGHRFLSSVQAKQMKGESERALLCKMWNGKGDYTNLSSGSRGFTQTSMSLFLLIQPAPLLSEIHNFTDNDGFLDRFLFFVTKPVMHQSSFMRENITLLEQYKIKDFVKVFDMILDDHNAENCITYSLSTDGQEEYDRIVDNYAEHIKDKYDSDDDDDKENLRPTSSQHENMHMTTSKDTIHILRLAAILHILNVYLSKFLEGKENVREDVSNILNKECIVKAQNLYNCLIQQKSVFVQAIMNSPRQDCNKLAKVKTFRQKVLRCLCNLDGPLLSVRIIQRHIKGALANNVKLELERLQTEGFGKLHTGQLGKIKRDVFFKPAPAFLCDDNVHLKGGEISKIEYSEKFAVKLTDLFLKSLLPNHCHYEQIIDMFID